MILFRPDTLNTPIPPPCTLYSAKLSLLFPLSPVPLRNSTPVSVSETVPPLSPSHPTHLGELYIISVNQQSPLPLPIHLGNSTPVSISETHIPLSSPPHPSPWGTLLHCHSEPPPPTPPPPTHLGELYSSVSQRDCPSFLWLDDTINLYCVGHSQSHYHSTGGGGGDKSDKLLVLDRREAHGMSRSQTLPSLKVGLVLFERILVLLTQQF